MIRKAILKDVNSIEDTYNEHFQYELNHTAFTVFKKGVYPTKDDAERAIYAGALFVYEENGTIVGSIIIDKVQPIEYATIPWKEKLSEDEVMVIHLLMVRKFVCVDPHDMPIIAVVDPDMMSSMPKGLTASTGMVCFPSSFL